MKLIDILRNAKSVAIVGASNRIGRPGYTLMKNLLDGGFEGEIYPVNPREESVLGIKCYPNVSSLPRAPDIVVIAVAAQRVPTIIEECGEKGAKIAVVISAGFSEIGQNELEKTVIDTARKYGIRVLGPNTAGLIYTPTKLFTSIEINPQQGDIAFIAQSGALASIVIEMLARRNLGLSLYIGLGNRADIDEVEAVEAALKDDYTRSIALYLEGFKRGRDLFSRYIQLGAHKPIILILGGKSRAGSRAATSHTASLASDPKIVEAISKQHGICCVDTLSELIDASYAVPRLGPISGRRVCIVTNSGGPSVLATDYIENAGFEIPELPLEVRQALSEILPPMSSLRNPIDMTAEADYEKVFRTLVTLGTSRTCDALVFIFIPTATSPWREVVRAVIDARREYGFNILVYVAGEGSETMVKELQDMDIAVATTLEGIASALRCATVWMQGLRRAQRFQLPS